MQSSLRKSFSTKLAKRANNAFNSDVSDKVGERRTMTAKDTISKLLYILLPPLFASSCWFFYQKLLQKLSVPQYQDIVLRTLIAVFLLFLYAISWIIYLSSRCNCYFGRSSIRSFVTIYDVPIATTKHTIDSSIKKRGFVGKALESLYQNNLTKADQRKKR